MSAYTDHWINQASSTVRRSLYGTISHIDKEGFSREIGGRVFSLFTSVLGIAYLTTQLAMTAIGYLSIAITRQDFVAKKEYKERQIKKIEGNRIISLIAISAFFNPKSIYSSIDDSIVPGFLEIPKSINVRKAKEFEAKSSLNFTYKIPSFNVKDYVKDREGILYSSAEEMALLVAQKAEEYGMCNRGDSEEFFLQQRQHNYYLEYHHETNYRAFVNKLLEFHRILSYSSDQAKKEIFGKLQFIFYSLNKQEKSMRLQKGGDSLIKESWESFISQMQAASTNCFDPFYTQVEEIFKFYQSESSNSNFDFVKKLHLKMRDLRDICFYEAVHEVVALPIIGEVIGDKSSAYRSFREDFQEKLKLSPGVEGLYNRATNWKDYRWMVDLAFWSKYTPKRMIDHLRTKKGNRYPIEKKDVIDYLLNQGRGLLSEGDRNVDFLERSFLMSNHKLKEYVLDVEVAGCKYESDWTCTPCTEPDDDGKDEGRVNNAPLRNIWLRILKENNLVVY